MTAAHYLFKESWTTDSANSVNLPSRRVCAEVQLNATGTLTVSIFYQKWGELVGNGRGTESLLDVKVSIIADLLRKMKVVGLLVRG